MLKKGTTKIVITRAGTNTQSDEYDSYREYRVANTNTVIRLFTRACASEEEILFGRSFIRQIHVGYIIHIKTETPIKTCNVLLAWEPPFKKI